MPRALDLASAVTTHLDAVGTSSRQAGSPLGRPTYCWGLTPFFLAPVPFFPLLIIMLSTVPEMAVRNRN
jgi:hypothetical protein